MNLTVPKLKLGKIKKANRLKKVVSHYYINYTVKWILIMIIREIETTPAQFMIVKLTSVNLEKLPIETAYTLEHLAKVLTLP
jgi:replicative superfamily II helicase